MNTSAETLTMRKKVKQPLSSDTPYPSVTRKALRENPNVKEVAESMGLHIATVYRHANGMDLKLIRQLKGIGLGTEEMVSFLTNEMTQPRHLVAKRLGVTRAYVSGVLNNG